MEKNQDELSGFAKIFKTLANSANKLGKACEETYKNITETDNTEVTLSCLQKGRVDFSLIEEDIKHIHQKLRLDGLDILGCHLIINDKEDYIEIKTFTQQGEKTLLDSIKFKCKSILNLPSDIHEKLEENGIVTLHLTIRP